MTPAPHARARALTLVAVGPPDRLIEAAGVLTSGDQAGSLRCVLIPIETGATLPVPPTDDLAVVKGLSPRYLNNAVAALRLSSLPTVVWWRGGPPDRLEGVASLADRVVLDAEEPEPLWARSAALFSRTAITDLRWAKLTRWRAVMAHLFDLPQVRAAASSFTSLSISGRDEAQCALFGGWLDASLGWHDRVPISRSDTDSPAALAGARLLGPGVQLDVRLLSNGACLASEARLGGEVVASRVVPAGDERLAALMWQELRVRSRDPAFERALGRLPGAADRQA